MSAALPRPAARAAALTLSLVAVGGCGAGFEAQTYLERSSADAANVAVGPIAVRNVAVLPDPQGTVRAGADADVRMTLVNVGAENDRLVGAASPAAGSVALEQDGRRVDGIVVPRLGSTEGTAGLVLRGVVEELRSGEIVEITLTFERAGEVVVAAPVATTGVYDENREKSANFRAPGEEEAPQAEGGGLSGSGQESTPGQG